nr:hypothetical protein [Kibdelosporangium sp. MJ126-NF4]
MFVVSPLGGLPSGEASLFSFVTRKKKVLAGRQASERETNPWSVHPVGCAHVTSRVQW